MSGPFWIAIAVLGGGLLLGPLGQALARYIEAHGRMLGAVTSVTDEDTEHRLARLEEMEARVVELEERLEFTERLLAQQRALPRPEADTPPEPVAAAH